MEFEPEPNIRRRWANAIWFMVWLAVTALGLYLQPHHDGHGTHQSLGLPPCPSVLFLGRPCPGCGMTTSWTALLHGDLPASFAAHPLGPITYLLFTAGSLISAGASLRGLRWNTETPQFNRGLLVVMVIFLGFGILRMATVTNYRTPVESVWHQYLVPSNAQIEP